MVLAKPVVLTQTHGIKLVLLNHTHTSWTFRYLLNLQVPLGSLSTYWTFRYLLDIQVSPGPLGTSWTFRYLLDLYIPLVTLGTYWTFRYLLELQVPLGPLGTSWTFRYLLDLWYHLEVQVHLAIDKDLWYRQQFMVLITPMVLTKIHGIELVILKHTHTRGPSVTRMRDFYGCSRKTIYK